MTLLWYLAYNCIAEYYSSSVKQGLVTKKFNADVQLQADYAILNSNSSNSNYDSHSDSLRFRILYNFKILY